MTGNSAKIEQWDRFWAYGNIHSFSQVSGGNYEGAVAEYWRSRFAALEERSRIVDVATGNGAIALLALEESDRLSKVFDIYGVDLADVDPAERVRDRQLAAHLRRIRFYGRTAAESLPFDDETVNLACSQFGLEYSDLSRSIPEVARVLKPRGVLAAIMHHRGSVLLRATHEELKQLDFVLNDAKLYLRARTLLRAMGEAQRRTRGKSDRLNPKLQKKRRALHDAMERIRHAAETSANPHMLTGPAQYVREIFGAQDQAQPAELLKWLDEALHRVTANQRRLMDMTEAARNEDDLHDIRELLNTSGFRDVELVPFCEEDGVVLGWQLEASKASKA